METNLNRFTEQIEESTPTQLESDITPSEAEGISIEYFLAELSEEEKQALAEEVIDELPRESVFGLGPYLKISPDYPKPDAFDRIEQFANPTVGATNINHELIHWSLLVFSRHYSTDVV